MHTINMFEQVHWANDSLLNTICAIDPIQPKALRLYAHIIISESVWLTRLNSRDSSGIAIWPEEPVALDYIHLLETLS